MIYKFTSSAAADVLMQRFSAEQMLSIIDKASGPIGVISVAEIPAAIATLEAEIKRQAQMPSSSVLPKGENSESFEPTRLRERMTPFIELLRISEKAQADVTWGI